MLFYFAHETEDIQLLTGRAPRLAIVFQLLLGPKGPSDIVERIRLCRRRLKKARMRHQPDSMLEAALAYARAGYPVFPCREDRKEPATAHGVNAATTDLEQIERWWDENPNYNIGYHPGGADQMVVDYDVGSDQEYIPVDGMTETLLVALTPSGGSHAYYALAEGEKAANSASKLGPKVDVRGYGGYVLVPPSQVNGKPYTWECKTKDGVPTGKPAYRSDELLAKANAYHEKHEDRDVWIIEPDI